MNQIPGKKIKTLPQQSVIDRGHMSISGRSPRKFIIAWLSLFILSHPLWAADYGLSNNQGIGRDRFGVLRLQALDGPVNIARVYDETFPAVLNDAVGPGDTLESGPGGRAELSQGNGLFIRMDENTRLEILTLGDEAGEGSLLARLVYGRIYIDSQAARFTTDGGNASMRLDTPDGSVWVEANSLTRVESYSDSGTVVIALSGRIQVLHPDGQLTLFPGQGVFGMKADFLPSPQPTPTLFGDPFERWNEDRRSMLTQYAYEGDYLPPDLRYEGQELYRYGNWRYRPNYGYVWIPPVSLPWMPYYQGHWSWVGGSYLWVPYEPWGWVTHHYGYWEFDISIGWFWIPHAHFSFAWVAWYDAGPYLGWCPLGAGYRPLFFHSSYIDRALNLFPISYLDNQGHPWIFVSDKLHLETPVLHQKVKYNQLDMRALERGRIATSLPESQVLRSEVPMQRLERHGYKLDGGRLTPIQSFRQVTRERPDKEYLSRINEAISSVRSIKPPRSASTSPLSKSQRPEVLSTSPSSSARPYRILPKPEALNKGSTSMERSRPYAYPSPSDNQVDRILPWAHRDKPSPLARPDSQPPPDSYRNLPWKRPDQDNPTQTPDIHPRPSRGYPDLKPQGRSSENEDVHSFMESLQRRFQKRDSNETHESLRREYTPRHDDRSNATRPTSRWTPHSSHHESTPDVNRRSYNPRGNSHSNPSQKRDANPRKSKPKSKHD